MNIWDFLPGNWYLLQATVIYAVVACLITNEKKIYQLVRVFLSALIAGIIIGLLVDEWLNWHWALALLFSAVASLFAAATVSDIRF